jgi:hypothetical protein
MRVIRKSPPAVIPPKPPEQRIVCGEWRGNAAMGILSAENRRGHIYPDGCADEYIPGAVFIDHAALRHVWAFSAQEEEAHGNGRVERI